MPNQSTIQNGNNNIVLQDFKGESVTINIHSLEEIQAQLEQFQGTLKEYITNLTQHQIQVLEQNIQELTNLVNIDFQPLEKEEMEIYASRLTEVFFGRVEERQLIKDFIAKHNSGTLFLFGSPGIGKSALIAKTYEEMQEDLLKAGHYLIPYFIRRGTESAQQLSFFRYLNETIEHILETAIPIQQDLAALRSGLHQRLRQAAQKLGQRKLILMIDGLDEGDAKALLSQISAESYPNVLVIYATRYTTEVEDLFFKIKRIGIVEDKILEGLKDEVVYKIIEQINKKHPIAPDLFPRIVDNSKGNPKYLELLELSLKKGILDLQSALDVPVFTDDFNDFYNPLIKSYVDHPHGNFIMPCLLAVVTAKDYLNAVQLAKITNLTPTEVGKAVYILNEVFIQKRDNKNNTYHQLFHESLREYLVNKKYYQVQTAKKWINNFCKSWKHYDLYPLKEYPIKHYATHLFELIQEEEHKDYKKDLYALARDTDFRKEQVLITNQYHAGFSLMEYAIRATQFFEEPKEAIDLVIETLKLHQEKNSSDLRIINWSEAGGKENIQRALDGILSLAIPLRPQIYTVLLYDVLFGINKNHLEKKEIVTTIIKHLDEHLDKTGQECKPFRLWMLIVFELYRLEIKIPFFSKRTDLIEAAQQNPTHPENWSYFNEFIATLDLGDTTIFDALLGMLRQIIGADATERFGYSKTLYLDTLAFLVKQLSEAQDLDKIIKIEQTVITEIETSLQSSTRSSERIVSRDRLLTSLIDMAILQKDYEKGISYIDKLHDFAPRIFNLIKLIQLLNELGRKEEAHILFQQTLEQGRALLDNRDRKDRAIQFLCQLASTADKIGAPAANVNYLLEQSMVLVHSGRRIRESELKIVLKAMLKIDCLSAEQLRIFSAEVIKGLANSYSFDESDILLLIKIVEQAGVEALRGLDQDLGSITFLDKVFKVGEHFYYKNDQKVLKSILIYILKYLENPISHRDIDSQIFRFKMKCGALFLRDDIDKGQQIINESLALQRHSVSNKYIINSSYIYAFPFLYNSGNQTLALALAEKATELTKSDDDLNWRKLIVGFIQIKRLETAEALMDKLLHSEILSTSLVDIAILILETGSETMASKFLEKIQIYPEKATYVYDTLSLGTYQTTILPFFRSLYLLDLEGDSDTIHIKDKEDVLANYVHGLATTGRINEALQFNRNTAEYKSGKLYHLLGLQTYQNQYATLLPKLQQLEIGYTGFYFNADQQEWLFTSNKKGLYVERNHDTWIDQMSEAGLFHTIAMDLMKRGEESTALKVSYSEPDHEEQERIFRAFAFAYLDKDKMEALNSHLKDKLARCENIYFWQSIIIQLAKKKQLSAAINLLSYFEQSKDSDKDNKRINLLLELAVQCYRQEDFAKADQLIHKIKKSPKPSHQNDQRATVLVNLLQELVNTQHIVKTGNGIESWINKTIKSEVLQKQYLYYSSYLSFYLEDYEGAFDLLKYVEDQNDKDFNFLATFSTELTYKESFTFSTQFALAIESDNDKHFPLQLVIEKLAQKQQITEALNLFKVLPHKESEDFLLVTIIKHSTLNQLPILHQFLQTELEAMSEETRYLIHRKFLAKVCSYPAEIEQWVHKDLVNQIYQEDNLAYTLFVEQLYLDYQKETNRSNKIKAILN